MKTIQLLIFSGLLYLGFTACGPNAEERAQQQRIHDDSVMQAGKRIQELKRAWQDSVKVFTQMVSEYENQLLESKASLEVENDKMNRIKEFQFLRSNDEKDQQIRDQKLLTERMTENIEILKSNIQIAKQNLKISEGQVKSFQ